MLSEVSDCYLHSWHSKTTEYTNSQTFALLSATGWDDEASGRCHGHTFRCHTWYTRAGDLDDPNCFLWSSSRLRATNVVPRESRGSNLLLSERLCYLRFYRMLNKPVPDFVITCEQYLMNKFALQVHATKAHHFLKLFYVIGCQLRRKHSMSPPNKSASCTNTYSHVTHMWLTWLHCKIPFTRLIFQVLLSTVAVLRKLQL